MAAAFRPTDSPRSPRWRRWGVRVLAGVAIMAMMFFAVSCAEEQALFPRQYTPKPLSGPTRPETVVLRALVDGGGQVEAWFCPAPAPGTGTSAAAPAPVVIFFHGNGELIDFQDGLVAYYHRLGWSVLLPEYRGYGRSAGRPSQAAIRADAMQFYDQLVQRPDVDRWRIVFHGRSLGGAVAADLARERRPAGLILESTFTSVVAMARQFWVPAFAVRNKFHTDLALQQVRVPVLIFHGCDDDIIPVSHGRALHALAPDSQYIELDCRHNDFPGSLANERVYRQALEAFLARYQATTQPSQ